VSTQIITPPNNTPPEEQETSRLTIQVDLDIKPSPGQSHEAAREEFLVLFRQYLTEKESPFQGDYGPEPWGGYDGPTVKGVTVDLHVPGTTRPRSAGS
jgi:hypothetical protein